MNIKSLGLSALTLSLALFHAPAVFAEHNPKEHPKDWIVTVTEKLDLSPEQKTKITILSEKAKIEAHIKHQELRNIHKHINESFRANDITHSKIDGFASQEQQLIGGIIKIRLQERFDIYNLLNDQQKEKMNQIIKEREEKHKEPILS